MYKAAVVFLRLLLPFSLGIVVAYNSVFPFLGLPLISLIVLYIAGDFLLRRYLSLLFRFEWLLGLALVLVLFYGGGVYTRLYIEKGKQDGFAACGDNPENNFAILKLIEPLEYKGDYSKAYTRVIATDSAGDWKPASATILLYIPNDKNSLHLNYGDCIIAGNTIHEVPAIVNPGQFDVKNYYATKNIYYSISLKKGKWKFTGINEGIFFMKRIFSFRNKCLTIINRSIEPEKERGVLASLLVGNREHLDYDLEQAFANTGVIHVLVVSGMRIGLVYLIINWLFNVIDRRRKWRVIRIPLIIILIWSFTILTGSAGSAIRAAMMISFVIIGKNANRQWQTINLLAASTFLITLIYGPLILFDSGFQLSFFAIVGIALFYSPILNFIEIKNKSLFEAWNITAVSIAATIGTLPFALYYFHRFPLYFILSNIIAVPLSTLTIYSGILLILFSPVPILNTVLNKITTFLLTCLDGFVNRMNALPLSSIHLSYFPAVDLILCLFVIAFLYLFFKQKMALLLQLSLSSLLLMCLVQVWHGWVQRGQHSLTVFSFPGANAIEFRGNNNSVFVSDSSVLTNEKSKRYFSEYWENNPPRSIAYASLLVPPANADAILQLNNYYQIDSVKCLLVDKRLPPNLPIKKLTVNYIIVANTPDVKISDLEKFYLFNKIIFSTSNHQKQVQEWIADCTRLKIPFYCVHDSGAFRLVW